jgi:ribosomal protein S27E
MKENNLQRLLLVGVVFTLLLLQIPALVSSQGLHGTAISESDSEMIGLSDYNGGGHMTVRITGEQAMELRKKIIWMFDENGPPSTRVPTGFVGETWDTDGNNNGVLDGAEVLRYSLWIQYYQWEGGKPFLYGEMTKAEMLEGETAATVELSTSGMVGTDLNSTEALEMKHLFNMRSSAQERNYLQSDNLTIQGLYRGFSYTRSNDFDQGGFSPFSGVGELGTSAWMIKSHDASNPNDLALWHGPTDTPEYQNRLTATTNATFDLRFASEAAMSFNYKGSVVSGDTVEIQIREEDGSLSTLRTLDSSYNTNTFEPLAFDLDQYVGERVTVVLNFTSDQSQNDTGFFFDDFYINAPCYYQGDIEMHHTDYLVGVLSYSSFYPDKGSTNLIRTPAGMIVLYSSSFDSASPSNDRAVFASFNFLDNPQILFGLMFVCAYLISHFQNKYYNSYRRMYAAMHREGWFKRKWIHWIGIILILLFIIFYFFPSLFVFAGVNFYLIGVASWLFYIVLTVVIIIGTKFLYIKAEQAIPEPTPEEEEIHVTVEAPEDDFAPVPGGGMTLAIPCSVCLEDLHDVAAEGIKCRCGQVFHKDCAAKAERCPNCNRLLEAVKPKEKRMLTVKCPACGDIVLVEGDADLLKTNCEACGSILQEVAEGYNYLIVDDNPSVAYEEFKTILRKDVPGLTISTTFPDKLKKEFEIAEGDLYWLSDTVTDPAIKTIDPKRLDFEMMRAVSNFFKDTPRGVLMIDGIEYLIVENGFDRVLRFVKKINDLASVNDATIFVSLTPSSLGKDEFAMLRKEFDKVQILTPATVEE